MGSDESILEAARISYKSPSKGPEQDKKLLHYLWKNEHTSPFEQCIIKFNIKLPLFVQAQMVRHRTQRLNQVSARYTEMLEDFYIPEKWRKQDTTNKQGSLMEQDFDKRPSVLPYADGKVDKYGYLGVQLTGSLNEAFTDSVTRQCKSAYATYQMLLNSGVSREMARMILPQNLYTEIYSQWDLHNLMHFFRLRLDPHAQFEIQEYAKAMFIIFEELYPWTAEVYKKYEFKITEKFP